MSIAYRVTFEEADLIMIEIVIAFYFHGKRFNKNICLLSSGSCNILSQKDTHLSGEIRRKKYTVRGTGGREQRPYSQNLLILRKDGR